jgi:hypothetical protein
MSIDNCQQCKCSLRTALVGDGCSACNPAQALEYCRENLAEAEAERDRYKALAGELARALNQCFSQLDLVLPTEGLVHDERQALIAAKAALAKYEQEKEKGV